MVRARVAASDGESDLYSLVFSIFRRHVMRDRLVTDYVRKRPSAQYEKNWSQDRALEDPTGERWRRGF